jgi:2,5-diketo-D-gluconate reductase A
MPQLGLGVWQTPPDATEAAVSTAFDAGYRAIDTAWAYQNEAGVGAAFAHSGLERDEVFITTKLWNNSHGYDAALQAFDVSRRNLGLDVVDLYLIHWPVPSLDLYVETWRALEKLYADGAVRAIGVSNFLPEHLDRLIADSDIVPAVNQIELHPHFQQAELRAADAAHGIVTQAWSPLGQGQVLTDPTITAIAEKHERSAAQVIIRWHLDIGNNVIPKSVTPARIHENIAVFDFALDADDLAAITAIDQDRRIGMNPMDVA